MLAEFDFNNKNVISPKKMSLKERIANIANLDIVSLLLVFAVIPSCLFFIGCIIFNAAEQAKEYKKNGWTLTANTTTKKTVSNPDLLQLMKDKNITSISIIENKDGTYDYLKNQLITKEPVLYFTNMQMYIDREAGYLEKVNDKNLPDYENKVLAVLKN